MYSYRGLSKEEYEDDYNEKIIHCNIHNVSGIDGCIACEQEEEVEEEDDN